MAEVENNTTKPKLEQEQVNESLIMLEAENKTTELDQVSNSWFKFDFIFKSQNWKNLMEIRNSQKWKTLMKIKDFALSCWKLADIIFDIISCCGFFRKWKVNQNKFF